MDIGSILLGLALLLVIAFVVARPLLEHASVTDTPVSPAEQLLAQREQVLTQLRDLDFDHSMSKINDVDYAAQRAQLVAQGVALLKQLDALGVPPDADMAIVPGSAADAIEAAVARRRGQPAPDAAASVEAAIEARVAERRASQPAPAARPAAADRVFCGQCGTPAQPGDRFCARCGAALAAPDAHPAQVQS